MNLGYNQEEVAEEWCPGAALLQELYSGVRVAGSLEELYSN